jgi:hypothetical protein
MIMQDLLTFWQQCKTDKNYIIFLPAENGTAHLLK